MRTIASEIAKKIPNQDVLEFIKKKSELVKILKEINKRILAEQGNLWPIKPTSITMGEYRLQQGIDIFLSSGDVGITYEDIKKEMNDTDEAVKQVIAQLIEEEFVVKQEHWLLEDSDIENYQLNLDQKTGTSNED